MKYMTMAGLMVFAGALGYGVAAYGQAGGGKADPVKVDAKHYKVAFENDSVRVLRISYAPGEKSVMHSHPNAVAVFLADAKTKMTMPDGKSEEMLSKAGEVMWTPAGSHLPQNISGTANQVVLVELKK
jgi:quercetin dioxygenase-like cupin family protein